MVKVGDELAFRLGFSGNYVIRRVEKITPSGRIKCGSYELNADLSVRGKVARGCWGPYRAEPVTAEIRENVERNKLLARVTNANWFSLDTVSLGLVVSILDMEEK
jgi:hypothetical protein